MYCDGINIALFCRLKILSRRTLCVPRWWKSRIQEKLEFIKNPVIAEFLGVKQDTSFTENDLEDDAIKRKYCKHHVVKHMRIFRIRFHAWNSSHLSYLLLVWLTRSAHGDSENGFEAGLRAASPPTHAS